MASTLRRADVFTSSVGERTLLEIPAAIPAQRYLWLIHILGKTTMFRTMWQALRSFWHEPRPPQPSRSPLAEWALVVLMVVAALMEALLRDDLVWRPVAALLGSASALAMLWRRRWPLQVFLLTFFALHAAKVIAEVSGVAWAEMYVSVYGLFLFYALFRWGSGKEALIGAGLMVLGYGYSAVREFPGLPEAIGESLIALFPAVLGAFLRYRHRAMLRELEQVKLLEREQLARELHDTVAHHVSTIAIHAQAGRALAPSQPTTPLAALEVIEAEASRALAELRVMVRMLRQDDPVALAPQPCLADIQHIAERVSGAVHVEVELSGELDALPSTIEATLYRLAQESVTNVVRHAHRATRARVLVHGDDEMVRLVVQDNGAPSGASPRSASGFGLRGMAERVSLLGGVFEAGPNAEGPGWTVRATLPRKGV